VSLPSWWDQAMTAVDAMMEKRYEIGFEIMRELDAAHPEWLLELRVHRKLLSNRSRNGTNALREKTTKRILVAMLIDAIETPRGRNDLALASRTRSAIVSSGLVSRQTLRTWHNRGLRDLEQRFVHEDRVEIEDDFEPADVRLERRRRHHAAFGIQLRVRKMP
jgi:hypothetical protein